jgi:hypothetical protein
MRRRIGAALASMMLGLGMAAVARADSGSITNVHALGDGHLEATFASSFSCPGKSPEDCWWYPHAGQVPASQPCPPEVTDLIYVGGFYTAPGAETTTDDFHTSSDAAIRLCLYAHSGTEHLLAETVYTPPLPTLAMGDARSQIKAVLEDVFEGTYTYGYRKRVLGCERRSLVRVRCRRVGWSVGDLGYRGTVTVWLDRASDGAPVSRYAYRISMTNYYCVNRKAAGDPAYRGKRCKRVHRS